MAIFENIFNNLIEFTVSDIIDILLVAVIVYFILKSTRKTRATQVLKGLGIIIVVAWICDLLKLPTVTWLLNYVIGAGAVILVILFQPEIRSALEKLGRGKILDFANFAQNSSFSDETKTVEELRRAVLNMSKHKTGALIVFEQKTGLKDVIATGTLINSKITSELLETIFFHNTPLHDGAVIIRNTTCVAAGCFLPLTDNKQLPSELGTRHRAALGISEVSDCFALIVSEETGVISVAHDGLLTRYVDNKKLTHVLEDIILKEASRSRQIKLKRKGAKHE